jgi:hypothetical protein
MRVGWQASPVADEFKLVVDRVEVAVHLTGPAQADTLPRSPRHSGVFGRKALVKC